MPTPIWEWAGSYAYSYLGVAGILCLLLLGSGRDPVPTPIQKWEGSYAYSYLGVGRNLFLLLGRYL
jgi:hypothetical protein